MSNYSKLIGSLIGTLTPAVVIGILALLNIHIDETVAAAIVTLVGTFATWIAPANKPVAAPVAAPVPPAAS